MFGQAYFSRLSVRFAHEADRILSRLFRPSFARSRSRFRSLSITRTYRTASDSFRNYQMADGEAWSDETTSVLSAFLPVTSINATLISGNASLCGCGFGLHHELIVILSDLFVYISNQTLLYHVQEHVQRLSDSFKTIKWLL